MLLRLAARRSRVPSLRAMICLRRGATGHGSRGFLSNHLSLPLDGGGQGGGAERPSTLHMDAAASVDKEHADELLRKCCPQPLAPRPGRPPGTTNLYVITW